MSGNPIAWLHEPTGNVFKDGECQALIKVWQEQFAASISAEEIAADFVPLVRADASSQTEKLREALEMIAGLRPCPDNLMGNVDIARAALSGSKE